jgi:hypothetical protein
MLRQRGGGRGDRRPGRGVCQESQRQQAPDDGLPIGHLTIDLCGPSPPACFVLGNELPGSRWVDMNQRLSVSDRHHERDGPAWYDGKSRELAGGHVELGGGPERQCDRAPLAHQVGAASADPGGAVILAAPRIELDDGVNGPPLG